MEVLKEHRAQIDKIDDEIMTLLGKRYDIVAQVAKIKHDNGIPATLPDRIEEVKARNAKHGEKYGLDPKFVRELFSLMIDHAISFENRYFHAQRESE